MSYLTTLKLQNFRCYEAAALNDINSGFVVITGPNGAGKTNILEAVSLLTPGRGLRSVKAEDIQKQNEPYPWSVYANIHDGDVANSLATGLDPQSKRRVIRINDAPAKSQAALSDYIASLWLTPQMDRLFIDGASARRKFFDRMIFAFDPSHSGRLTRYENAMRQRSKLLQDQKKEDVWLYGLEAQMSETAIAIVAARNDFLERLSHAFIDDPSLEKYFPKAQLSLKGDLEGVLEKSPALEVENYFQSLLKNSREQDSITGGAKNGPHKTDFVTIYQSKNMSADQCSTGEQKALLISITLAFGTLLKAERNLAPILLLDEIAAHLDESRREALFDQLEYLGGQVWMTGTDHILFDSIAQKSQKFLVENAQIEAA
ncbi:MAG: DNA replication/repair protein RecF [Pseudomonadota bacterium]